MLRPGIILAFILTIPIFSHGQSMAAIFKLLPATCTPELNIKGRSILLRNKEYIIPGNDSEEIVKYNMYGGEKENYLRYEYTFTTGQSGFAIFELRKFIKTDGSALIIFSSYGGSRFSYEQNELTFFEVHQNKLVQLKRELLPANIETEKFMKKDCPDSTRSKLKSYACSAYDLDPELKNAVRFKVFFNTVSAADEKLILNDIMIFKWTGKSFTKGQPEKKVYFQF